MRRKWIWISILLGAVAITATIVRALNPFPAPLAFLRRFDPVVEPQGDEFYTFDTIDDSVTRIYLRQPHSEVLAELKRELIGKQHWIEDKDSESKAIQSTTYVTEKGSPVEVEIRPNAEGDPGYPEYKCLVCYSRHNSGFQRWWFKFRYDRGWIKGLN